VQRIRTRNTALVQLATAVFCPLVGILVVCVECVKRPEVWRMIGASVPFILLAIWMVRRGQRGLRALEGARPAIW